MKFRLFYLSLILFSLSAIADGEICMIKSDAFLYNCVQRTDEASNLNCQKTLGSEFFAYQVDDNCTLKLSYEFLGKEFTDDSEDISDVDASCLIYEIGQENNCSVWEYEAAYRFCGMNYGDKYLPHRVNNKCSTQLADKEYGYISSELLNIDLPEKMDEANAILTMIDRHGFDKLFLGMVSKKPIIANEFYNNVMKGLLSKLKIINSTLEKRSHFKVKFEKGSEDIANFIGTIIEYQNFVGRVHKVYAYVAHRNHQELYSYKFSNLDFLNLKLGKEFAQEVLSRVNYKTRTISDTTLELFESEANKQLYEYVAISEPENEVDYAKLVTFLGIRENLVNIWAVDRLSKENLLDSYQGSCGDFLSFSQAGKLQEIASIKENIEYDVFYNKYLMKIPQITKSIGSIKLLDDSMIQTLRKIYENHNELKSIVDNYIPGEVNNESLTNHFKEDINILESAEADEWLRFSNEGFRSIVYPGDDILNRDKLVAIIVEAVYKFKVSKHTDLYLGQYPWISKKEQDSIETNLKLYFEKKKPLYLQIISNKLKIELNELKRKDSFVAENLENKISSTLEVAKKYLTHANASIQLDENISAGLKPDNYQEMALYFQSQINKKYQDIKYTLDHNEKLSKELKIFFDSVAEKFNRKYLIKDNQNQIKLIGEPKERSRDLWKYLLETARSIYVKNNFQLGKLSPVPSAVKLSRNRKNLSRNPYTTQIEEDGTPITVHVNELLKMFQEDLKVNIPFESYTMRTEYILGLKPLFELGNRNNTDQITDGTFGRPLSYLNPKGEVVYINNSPMIDQKILEKIYLQALDLTKLEIKENTIIKDKMIKDSQDSMVKDYEGWWGLTGYMRELYYKAKGYSSDRAVEARRKKALSLKKEDELAKSLKTSKQLFERVFEVFNLPLLGIHNSKGFDRFYLSIDGQKTLVKNKLSKAYGIAPILRNEISVNAKVKKMMSLHPHNIATKFKVFDRKKRSLLRQIGLHAYNPEKNELNEDKARELILKTINQAKENVKDKIDIFCKANYKNYGDDDSFKKAFNASTFLRATLKSDIGTTPKNAKNIRLFDESVRQNIRSNAEMIHEDYLEPTIMILGAASLIALGIMASAFTFGTAAPAFLTGASALASAAITHIAFNTVFVGLIVMSTGFKINNQFLEVPEQLKFQTSLAKSQIDFGKVADYDMINKAKGENSTASIITLGFLPLDLFFGYTVGAQIKSAIGITGVKAYKDLTGISLKSKTLHSSLSFKTLRQKYGDIGAVYNKANSLKNGLMARLPKYQDISKEMINIGSLRAGLVRMLKDPKVEKNSLEILSDVQIYSDQFFGRFSKYKKYIGGEEKVVKELILNGGLTFSETMQFGRGNTGIFFRLNSEIKAIKSGNYLSYRRNYGVVIDQLKHLQASLLNTKYERLESLIKKIKDYKRIGPAMDAERFLRRFTDHELYLLGEISNKSSGGLGSWKQFFKLHKKVVESLRPMSYLYGYQGAEFSQLTGSGLNYQNTYKTETQDITNFYESMVKLHGFKTNKVNNLRKDFEQGISVLFRLDKNGSRVYN